MATRSIFKNVSTFSFKGNVVQGCTDCRIGVSSDVDRQGADNELTPIIFGVQNKEGTIEAEFSDLKDVSGVFSVGESGSARATGKAKFTSTATDLTVIAATTYCQSIDYNMPHGSPASVRVTFAFVPPLTYS